ncbi:MAG TPA: hypothetical protein VFJ01_10450 [Oleiagrimonas sp.]|nr:hypothetical protein [Oleiagrimonas sp.]
MSRQRYYFSIPDFAAARGKDPDLAFEGRSPEALADALQRALRMPDLFERWRAKQEDPDKVDKSLAAVDAQAEVHAEQADLKVDMQVATDLPMRLLRQRLEWLIGSHWRLHDVR